MPKKKPDQEPLTRDQLRMVSEFRKYRDIYKAAEKAKIPKNQAVKVFNLITFQEELDRQDEAVRGECAKLEASVTAVTRDFLDNELISFIREEKGALKKEAIQLGYVVAGIIQNGSTRSLTAQIPDPNDDRVPGGSPTFIYRATVQGEMTQVPEHILPTDAIPPPPPLIPPAAPATKPISPNRAGPLKIG